jgi:hypothetical protein
MVAVTRSGRTYQLRERGCAVCLGTIVRRKQRPGIQRLNGSSL